MIGRMAVDWTTTRAIVTGGAGFLGRVVCELLAQRGCAGVAVPRSSTYDLTEIENCRRLFDEAFDGVMPDMVIHLAAEVGGIEANRRRPGRFFYANMSMAMNLIEVSRERGMADRGGKFVLAGTICAYPKFTPVPFREEELWNGYPEETNGPYGIAKKAAGVMLDAYHREYGLRGAYMLPVNLYGPHDNFDPVTSHVIPALVRKFVEARDSGASHVDCWGTGSASREFLYVDDAAAGIVRAAEVVDVPEPMNLGIGDEITIRDLSEMIARLTGFEGELRWDPTKPDGQPRRSLDVSRATAALEWRAGIGLEEGLRRTIAWWESNRGD